MLVFICIGSRRIEYVACTSNPDGAWMLQQARNLLMDLDDCGQRPRLLIRDRDEKFSRAFDAIFDGEGISVIRTPIQAPNANAHIERWVMSVAHAGAGEDGSNERPRAKTMKSATDTARNAGPFGSRLTVPGM